MIAPRMHYGLTLTLTGEMVSIPYIEMTLGMMARFGIEARRTGNTIRVPAGEYRPAPFRVEPDWSAASYWYEIAALAPAGTITLPGLSTESLQGDARIAALFEPLGINTLFSSDGAKLIKSDHRTNRIPLRPLRTARPGPNPRRNLLPAGSSLPLHRTANPAHQGDRPHCRPL